MTGDIVLINARGKRARANVKLQRVWTLDKTTRAYTHVALLLGTYRVVHAMPAPDHVEFTVIQELLSPQDTWAIWRQRAFAASLKADTDLYYKFLWRAELFVGERYNNPTPPRFKEHHSFCSELIGKVYADLGFPFSGKPEHLMPIAIAKAVQRDSHWFNETSEYRRLLADDPRYRQLHGTRDPDGAMRVRAALREAKDAAKVVGALAEPFEQLQRFDRWKVEQRGGGSKVWTPKFSLGHRVLSREAVEWLSLLLLDAVDFDLVNFYTSLGGSHET